MELLLVFRVMLPATMHFSAGSTPTSECNKLPKLKKKCCSQYKILDFIYILFYFRIVSTLHLSVLTFKDIIGSVTLVFCSFLLCLPAADIVYYLDKVTWLLSALRHNESPTELGEESSCLLGHSHLVRGVYTRTRFRISSWKEHSGRRVVYCAFQRVFTSPPIIPCICPSSSSFSPKADSQLAFADLPQFKI